MEFCRKDRPSRGNSRFKGPGGARLPRSDSGEAASQGKVCEGALKAGLNLPRQALAYSRCSVNVILCISGTRLHLCVFLGVPDQGPQAFLGSCGRWGGCLSLLQSVSLRVHLLASCHQNPQTGLNGILR